MAARFDFSGQVAIVTGAASGIGEATAQLFNASGARVTIVDVDEAGEEVAKRFEEESGVETMFIRQDVSKNPESIIQQTVSRFGRLDVLVNNAAIFPAMQITNPEAVKTFERVLNINLLAPFRLLHAALPHLQQTGGCIVNVSSILSSNVMDNLGLYIMSKAALDSFTRVAGAELFPSGVRVNTVNPGHIWTPSIYKLADPIKIKATRDFVASNYPMKRYGESIDVARAILFLASDSAKQINGINLRVDSGFYAALANPSDFQLK